MMPVTTTTASAPRSMVERGDILLQYDQERPVLILELSEEMNDRIEELTSRIPGASEAEIINQAIGLYKAVSDAIRAGKRVGIIDDPEVELDTEFVDF